MSNTHKKNVSIGGKTVITDWRKTRIVSPENFQGRIKANEDARNEIKKQKATQKNNASTTMAL